MEWYTKEFSVKTTQYKNIDFVTSKTRWLLSLMSLCSCEATHVCQYIRTGLLYGFTGCCLPFHWCHIQVEISTLLTFLPGPILGANRHFGEINYTCCRGASGFCKMSHFKVSQRDDLWTAGRNGLNKIIRWKTHFNKLERKDKIKYFTAIPYF